VGFNSVTAVTSRPTPTSGWTTSQQNHDGIIGGSIAGVFILLIIIGYIFYRTRRRKRSTFPSLPKRGPRLSTNLRAEGENIAHTTAEDELPGTNLSVDGNLERNVSRTLRSGGLKRDTAGDQPSARLKPED
jgi:hypothetical protein